MADADVGRLRTLRLERVEGRPGLWAHPAELSAALVDPSFDAALHAAWLWACGAGVGVERLSVRWKVLGDSGDPRTSGGSAGAAAAVGLAYLTGLAGGRRKVDLRCALSATVDDRGILGPVSELPTKLGRGGRDWRRLVVCSDDEQTARRVVGGGPPKIFAADDVLQAARKAAQPRVSIRTAVAAVAVAVLALALVSWHLADLATDAARVSRVNARDSQAFHLASLAGKLAAAEPATALRLAVSAFRLDPASVDTRAALVQLTQADPRIRSYLGAEGGPGITRLAGSLSGQVVVSADSDGAVRSWDPGCATCRPSILSRGAAVGAVAVARDGALVAVVRGDRIKLTTPAGRRAAGWPAGALRVNDAVDTVAINDGGDQIAAGTSDGGVYVWTRGRPAPEHGVVNGAEPVSAAVFLPDGRLVTGTAAPDRQSSQELVVWKTASRNLTSTVLVSPLTPNLIVPGVRALAVVGSDLVVGETYLEVRPLSSLSTVRKINVPDAVDALVPLDPAHVLVGTTSSLTISAPPYGGTPSTSFADVDTATGRTQDSPFSGSLTCLTPAAAVGPGHTILTGTTSGVLAEWSPAKPKASEVLRIVPDPLDRDGVIVSRENGSVDAFDAATGRQSTIIASRHGPATALAAKGDAIFAGYVDGTVLRLTRRPGATPVRLLHLPEKVLSLALDPAGDTLAVGGSSGQVTLFNATTSRLLRTLPHPHLGGVYDIAFDPAGELIASSDVKDSLIVQRVNGTAAQSTALLSAGLLAWLNDSELIAGDGEGRLYRLALPLPASPSPIAHPDTSNILGGGLDPAHQSLVIASADQTAVLFDLSADQPLGRFSTLDASTSGPFAAAAWAASFTPGGRYAVFGTAEGHLQTLTTDTAILTARACAMAPSPPATASTLNRTNLQAATSACP
ncbi:MAG: WD40 repeat domain-containing protein [Streptosporangiaceae bacterium]